MISQWWQENPLPYEVEEARVVAEVEQGGNRIMSGKSFRDTDTTTNANIVVLNGQRLRPL